MSGESGHPPSARTDRSDPTDRPEADELLSVVSASSRQLRASGGYRQLRSFQVATIIYDATVSFCDRFVDRRSRTRDQMVQAARSGRQNIAEGSRASAASSQTELRLVSVARASLDELLLDYEDFLRQRGKRQWAKDDPEARAVREVGRRQSDRSDPTGGVRSKRSLCCLAHARRAGCVRQCDHLPDPSGQLPPGPPDGGARASIHPGGRI